MTLTAITFMPHNQPVTGKQPVIGFGDLVESGDRPQCISHAAFLRCVLVLMGGTNGRAVRFCRLLSPVRQPVQCRPPVWRRLAVRKTNWRKHSMSNNTLTPFSFDNHPVRTVMIGGDIWFVAKDVMNALGYSKTSKPGMVISHLPDEWKGVNRIDTLGGKQEISMISEQGLYFFLGRSDKPKALPFQKWLAGEVLPQIRKTGSYVSKQNQQPKTPAKPVGRGRVYKKPTYLYAVTDGEPISERYLIQYDNCGNQTTTHVPPDVLMLKASHKERVIELVRDYVPTRFLPDILRVIADKLITH